MKKQNAMLTFWGCMVMTFLVSFSVMGIEYNGPHPAKGAKTKLELSIVDDEGNPVKGAEVFVRFERCNDYTSDEGKTNKEGKITVSGKCWHEMGISVKKEGYYDTLDTIDLNTEPGFSYEKGKWQPYGGKRNIVLRPSRKKIPMYMFVMTEWKNLEAGKKAGYDLETGSFVEPLGDGKVADFYVEFTFDKNEERIYKTLTLSFPNPFDGAYVFDCDMSSKFWSPHHANPDADYKNSLKFDFTDFGNKADAPSPIKHILEKNQGLILRTRTKVDENGKLISARYGKIYGPFDIEHTNKTGLTGGGFTSFFNPYENDTNLESDSIEHTELQKGERNLNSEWKIY